MSKQNDEKKSKRDIKTRQPQKRTDSGIFANLRQLPHPVEEILGLRPLDQVQDPKPAEPISDQIEDQRSARAESAPSAKIGAEPVRTAPDAKIAKSAESAPDAESAPSAEPALFANIAQVQGHTAVPNSILDGVLCLLPPSEQSIYLRLFRLSHGFRQETCKVGFDRLAKACCIGRRTAIECVEKLEKRGLIQRLGADFTASKMTERGNIYRVFIPSVKSALVAKNAPSAKSAQDARFALDAPSALFKRDLKKQYLKIAGDKRDLLVGGSPDQIEAMMRGWILAAGLEWNADLWKEIAADRG